MEEKLLGVFPIDIYATMLYDFYDMYFTDRRVVANAVGRGLYPRAIGNLVVLVMGGLLDYGIIRPLLAKHQDKTRLPDMEQVLKAHKGNFEWDYQKDIQSVKLRKKTGLWGPPAIVVGLSQGKEKICVFRKQDLAGLTSLLREVVGEKLVSPTFR